MSRGLKDGYLRYRHGEWIDCDGDPVEIELVVHAHWICDCEPYHICSNCHHKFSLFDRVPRCPNCGAHMDEEVTDGT